MNDTTTARPLDSPPPPAPGPLPQPTTPNPPPPVFPRSTSETPRAYSAFMTYFQLGHARSLQDAADLLGENLSTIKTWSSKFRWADRLHAFNSGLLQQQACDQAELHRRQATAWAQRLDQLREQEWDVAQKLLLSAQCFLESIGEEDLRRMNLAHASRAVKISSAIARLALAGAELPKSSDPLLSPTQNHLLAALKQAYGSDSPSGSPSGTQPSALNPQPQ